jgi:hypothetical protein
MEAPEERLLNAILGQCPPTDDSPEVEASAARIELKVYGGTPIHGVSLCNTCRRAQRLKGMADSQEIVWCNAGPYEKKIPFPVSSCSLYDDQRQTSLYEMKEIAWQIVTKPNKTIGFVSAKEFKQLQWGKDREDYNG